MYDSAAVIGSSRQFNKTARLFIWVTVSIHTMRAMYVMVYIACKVYHYLMYTILRACIHWYTIRSMYAMCAMYVMCGMYTMRATYTLHILYTLCVLYTLRTLHTLNVLYTNV